jgi:hypothetical protein
MVDILESPTKDFKNAAAPEKTVAVDIPVELTEYYQSAFGRDWQAQIVGDLKFFMDSQKQRQEEVGHLLPQPEPGEDAPIPALT